jgi:hypothetical protein
MIVRRGVRGKAFVLLHTGASVWMKPGFGGHRGCQRNSAQQQMSHYEIERHSDQDDPFNLDRFVENRKRAALTS